jgi:hypothetical protein
MRGTVTGRTLILVSKLVRQLQGIGYRVTLEEVEAVERSRHVHHSPGAIVR